VVVGYGRCIVEAMACGRAAYVWDHMGGDGWVTPASYPALEADGFGGRATGLDVDAARLRADLAAYDPEMGVVNRDIAVRAHGPRQHAQALVEILREAGAPAGEHPPLAELARLARVAWDLERRAMGLSRRVEGEVAARREEVAAHRARTEALAVELREARAAAAVAEAEAAVARARAAAAERELTAARADDAALKATRRYRMAAALARPLDRAREVARRGGAPPPAEPAADEPGDPAGPVAAAPGEPELAVVVFSHRAQPTLVRAVRSVLAQGVPVELLVVNSGGGDAPGLLSAAGLDVRVVEHPERLFPGGACNVGLRETSAPFVAFVAGDLELRPGWVAGRLLRHRAGRAAVAAALVPVEPAGAAGRSSYLLLNHRRTPWTPPGEALRFSLSYDRRLFERYGVFREDLRVGEDLDMQQRFGTEVDIEFAPDVQAAHHGPDGVPAMLRDQFVRGRRMAYTRAWTEGADWRGRIARNALRNVRLGARAGLAGAGSPREVAQVAGAAPLLVPGAAAYAAGALTAPLGGARRRRRTRRLIALVQFKDELRYLPGLFENLAPHVDGVVALDDGSTDGSAEYVAGRPEVLELLPGLGGGWDEASNRERLIRAAWEHGADWLYGIDADERVERHFRARAERILARAEADGESAFYVRLRELWDAPDRVRVDGVWSRKLKACLFRARRDHAFDRREFHGHWAPRNDREDDRFPIADLLVYHLRMVHADDRAARRARYEALDPEARWQSIGYAYLTSAEELVTAPLPYGRDFTPLRDR
jgi:GT2 family glycosyltransferase